MMTRPPDSRRCNGSPETQYTTTVDGVSIAYQVMGSGSPPWIVFAPLYVVYFETAFSSARAWSIWSYAYATISAVVIVSPSRASDS